MNIHKAVATFRGHEQPHFDFIGKTRRWFTISGIIIILSLVGLFVRGLNYSIDFEGGGQLRYPNPSSATVAEVKSVLAQYGRGDAEVQVVGTGAGESEIVIRTRSLTDLGVRRRPGSSSRARTPRPTSSGRRSRSSGSSSPGSRSRTARPR